MAKKITHIDANTLRMVKFQSIDVYLEREIQGKIH